MVKPVDGLAEVASVPLSSVRAGLVVALSFVIFSCAAKFHTIHAMSNDPLLELLRPERLTAVVDVGANPIDGDPPYKTLLAKRGCRVVGFEPQPEALAILNTRKSDLETYLPDVIADGNPATLRICSAAGMTSLYKPAAKILNHFRSFPEWGTVVKEISVSTTRLDNAIAENALDFLKIDIQGGELTAIENAPRCLAQAVAIQTEVSFLPLYEEQPTFAEIDQALRKFGFIPHTFAAINRRMIAPLFDEQNPYAALNQLLEADVVYVRDFTQPQRMSDEQLKHLAIIAHHCYRSFDLAMNCIVHLCQRQVIAAESIKHYAALAVSLPPI
jgi:FkbM family methyltransferase